MTAKDTDKFLGVLKYFMMVAGHWRFRNEKNKFVSFYEKSKYTFLIIYMYSPVIFVITIIKMWKCEEILTENLFTLTYTAVVVLVIILLNSEPTRKIIDYIHNFEDVELDSLSEECQVIYQKATDKNNRMILFFFFVAALASVSWFYTGKR